MSWVLCVVPSYKSPTTFVVFAFEAKADVWFNKALEALGEGEAL